MYSPSKFQCKVENSRAGGSAVFMMVEIDFLLAASFGRKINLNLRPWLISSPDLTGVWQLFLIIEIFLKRAKNLKLNKQLFRAVIFTLWLSTVLPQIFKGSLKGPCIGSHWRPVIHVSSLRSPVRVAQTVLFEYFFMQTRDNKIIRESKKSEQTHILIIPFEINF